MHSLFLHNPTRYNRSLQTNTKSDADIFENEQSFVMELAVPGFEKEHFTISASEHKLMLSATRDRVLPEGFSTVKDGALSGKWERTFRFRQPVKADSIEAVVANGVLKVTIPKKTQKHMVTVQAC